jgi:hypothetical protein
VKRWAWLWSLVALLLLLPLLGGCGGKATPSNDPFVGTWREQQSNGKLGNLLMVITRSGDGYLATFVYMGNGLTSPSPRPGLAIPLTRQGDKLTGTYSKLKLRVEIVALPRAGHATWANSRTATGPLNKPTALLRATTGTAYPTSL